MSLSVMLRPEDTFRFGKYKGQLAKHVWAENPSYFYWLQESGVSQMGKDFTEALEVWVEENPKEAAKTKASAMKAKVIQRDAELHTADSVGVSDVGQPPAATVHHATHASWGSW